MSDLVATLVPLVAGMFLSSATVVVAGCALGRGIARASHVLRPG